MRNKTLGRTRCWRATTRGWLTDLRLGRPIALGQQAVALTYATDLSLLTPSRRDGVAFFGFLDVKADRIGDEVVAWSTLTVELAHVTVVCGD